MASHIQLTAQEGSSGDIIPQDTLITTPERDFINEPVIPGNQTDTSVVPVDTLGLAADTLQTDTAKVPKGEIETTINYNARDSMFFDLENRKLHLYGETHVDYGDISLDAERTTIDWVQRTIKADYVLDTAGKKVGRPVFTQEGEVYETDHIIYNFRTKRALIKGVVTEQEGAYMHGEDVKMNEEKELFIKGAKYTTCNLADPHFFIESEKLKVIPGNKVISGPFNLKFKEIPTPLWLPFGMFPQPRTRTSGIVFPSYGLEQRRGFFLRDGGYYFSFNEYIDLRLTGDIYSKGSTGLNALTNYKKRYAYSGSFSFSYNRSVSDDIESPLQTNDFWIRWSHRPETRGNSSFSASVSAGTSTYNNNTNLITQDYERSISSQFSSNISYSQRFQRIPFNMSANLRHNQNIQTGIMNLTLPEFSLNMNRIYPFKNLVRSSKSPLAKISLSHNFVAKNELTNAPQRSFNFNVVNEDPSSQDTIPFNLSNIDRLYDRARIGGRHAIPISTSFNLLKYFTVSPSFNYTELWYTRELDFEFVPEENGVRVDTINGFSRAGYWSSGASLNTRLYGTVNFKGDGKIKAIRHVITPSISFSYNPDFTDERYGVYERVRISDSDTVPVLLSKYEGFAYGSPPGGESRSIGFSMQNNLEMKVRDDKDSTQQYKKVKIFDNLSTSASYNLAAEEFKLSNINWSTRTSFFENKMSVALSGTFDPYMYRLISEEVTAAGERRVVQERIDRYAWNNGRGLGNLRSFTTSIGLNLSPRKKDGSDEDEQAYDNVTEDLSLSDQAIESSPYGTEAEKEYIRQNPEEYVDFNLPWSLRVQYSINRTKVGFEDPRITQTLTFGGSLGLTGKTQITYNSGFDIEAGEFTQTRIGVSRDLHCWTLNFSWVPFGRYQSFSLVIRPKSPILQDLKLERKRNFFDFFDN